MKIERGYLVNECRHLHSNSLKYRMNIWPHLIGMHTVLMYLGFAWAADMIAAEAVAAQGWIVW